MIRKAKVSDIKQVHKLLSTYAEHGTVLPRSLSELYDQLRDIFVYVNTRDDTIVGTCAMHICWENIAEIRSLAIQRGREGEGIGNQLVKACMEEAMVLEVEQLFVLTYIPGFFEKFGFKRVDKSILPHKVWSDCLKCVKFPDCNEEALLLTIKKSRGKNSGAKMYATARDKQKLRKRDLV